MSNNSIYNEAISVLLGKKINIYTHLVFTRKKCILNFSIESI